MKTKFISIQSSVSNWMDDSGFGHQELNEKLLIKWAGDCVKWASTQEQLRPRFIILNIENSRARLPEDYEMLGQAASNAFLQDPCDCDTVENPDCCQKSQFRDTSGRLPKTRREDLVQWVQGTYEKDCELEINLKCPRCHTTGCSCDTPWVEVDVDRIWDMAHPEIYYSNFTRIGRFGNGPGQNSPHASAYTPKFHLMKYAVSDFHRLKQVVADCPNVNCDNCYREFIIEDGWLEVDFDKGEVLLAYLGKRLDDDGEIMIPDHPDVHEAIFHHLNFKWFWRLWLSEKDVHAQSVALTSKQLSEQHVGYAKSELEIPEAHQFKNYLESSSFMKRVPGWNMDTAGKRTRDKGRDHEDRLKRRGRYRYYRY